jgi:hypothetical protein
VKIDIHCHTKKIRSGEPESRAVTKEVFLKSIQDAGVGIVAITNHDVFDKKQYDEFVKYVGSNFQIWPGIELDTLHDRNKFHLILVGDPACAGVFDKKVKQLTDGKSGDFTIELDNIINHFSGENILYIPHFGSKRPAISEDNLAYLKNRLDERSSRVIVEDTNIRSTGILTSHGFNAITGSDVRNWDNYSDCEVSSLRLPIDTFGQFCLFLDRDKSTIETMLNKTSNYGYTGRPKEDDPSITIPVKLYNEVNILFGDKGLGKTNILKSVRAKAEADGKKVSTYIASEKDDYFNKLLDASDMYRTASKLGMDACEEEFTCIKQWSDETPTSLQLYTDHAKSAETRKAKTKIKLSETKPLDNYDSRKLKKAINDRDKYKEYAQSIKQIAARYVSDRELTSFEEAIDSLYNKITEKVRNELILKYTTDLYNHAIKFINNKVSEKTDTAPKPDSPGFTQYARNKLELKQSLDKITGFLKLKDKKHTESFGVGELGDKGDLYIQKEWSMLGKTGYEKYKSSIKIEDLKNARTYLNKLKGGVFSDSIENILDDCRSSLSQIDSLDVFVGLRKYPTLNDNGEEYSPSNGEKAIIAIQRALDRDANFYVLDEPELSLGGEYIDNIIREKISKLGRAKKTVFIATHNANIAVRTLPYTSIYRKYDKGEYKTYVGNPFTNKLLNINDENDVLSWREESMRTLEGGEAAFKNRGEIYESGK